MNEYKFVLADGTQIAIDGYDVPLQIHATFDTIADAATICDYLTPENLAEVGIEKDGSRIAQFREASLQNVQLIPRGGKIKAHYYFSADVSHDDYDYAQAARILFGEVN